VRAVRVLTVFTREREPEWDGCARVWDERVFLRIIQVDVQWEFEWIEILDEIVNNAENFSSRSAYTSGLEKQARYCENSLMQNGQKKNSRDPSTRSRSQAPSNSLRKAEINILLEYEFMVSWSLFVRNR
jgi:hypothetical protein